jgi:succinoglycan biosynthesis transport protein ExoP
MNPSREIVVRAAPITSPSHIDLSKRELTIRDFWNILVSRKGVVYGVAALCVGATILYCVFATRLYRAVGEVQVQKETADALGLDNMIGSAEGASDALDGNITLQTQAQVLQSDSLALQVVKELDLEQNEDFRPRWNPMGWALPLVSPDGPKDPSRASLDDAPARRTHALKTFASRLTVKPVSGTRLIEVSYLNPDPKVAAAVVNHLVQDLIEFNFQTRHNATQIAAGWLGRQLSDLRKESEDLQAKVVHLQHDSGVFTLGQSDTQGREQVYTPVLDKLQQATAQLGQAQSARIIKGAVLQIVKNEDPELISGLAGSGSLAAATPILSGSLNLIQNLRAQEAATQAQLNELSAKFGPGYPKLAEVSASLLGIQAAIHKEAARIASRARNDYTMAKQVEDSARAVFLSERQQADALNDKTVEYEIVREEATQSRNLYESLLRRLKEADLVAGLRSSNITVVDPALVTSRPARPSVLLYLTASVAGGLFIGICAAFFRDTTDTKIHNLSGLEYFGETPVAILPRYAEKLRWKIPSKKREGLSRAAYLEAMRTLRTSLIRGANYSTPQVILVTSSVPNEGKTMLSSNLSLLLAQQNKRVLLVDGDLRTPALHERFHLNTNAGFSSVLALDTNQAIALAETLATKILPGLDVLPAGPVPAQPAELLASESMAELTAAWRKRYDFIIIDGAPVLPVTDSVILSAHADLTLVVARHKVTERQSLERTRSILQSQGTPRMALVLNGVEPSSRTYFHYYGYTNRTYYGRNQCAN